MTRVGLRIDVDTLRGTRLGVPNLLDLMKRHQIRASFFFSVGPDNMGRHLWRLIRPSFLFKMLRTKATRLYGWDILLRGTIYPGPVIGKRCPGLIREAAANGHEIGLHAWDHYRWQTRLQQMDQNEITSEIRKGYNLLARIRGSPPDCFAAPAWQVTPEALLALDGFYFKFESDCRGYSLFRPAVYGRRLAHLQVPVTLPTYDECIGLKCTPEAYNEYILEMIRPDRLNVLTIHAEVEGIENLAMFREFLEKAEAQGISFEPLGTLLPQNREIMESGIEKSAVSGRDGWIACQV